MRIGFNIPFQRTLTTDKQTDKQQCDLVIQWSLPKRTLREADNPSTTDKPRGTELTCHEYNNS